MLTRNTCMQQPLALIGIQRTIFSEYEVFRVYDFEIVFIFTLSIFFKKCENNESIISFNYKIHNLHIFLVSNTTRNTCMQQPLALIGIQGTIFSEHEVFRVYDFEIDFYTFNIFQKM